MATRTVANGGGNYNSTGTWVEAAVPTSADDVVFTGTSGQLTVNVASAALTINFTNYTNTITMTSTLTVSGNVTLMTGFTVAGSGALIVNATSTLTSNGKSWDNPLTFSNNTIVYTFADQFTCSTFSMTGSNPQLNGSKLNISASFVTTANTLSGTTEFVMTGTGTLAFNGSTCRNNITINSSGTVTIGNIGGFDGHTFKYTAGTTICTGSVTCATNACTFDTNGSTSAGATTTSSTGINFNNLSLISTTFNSPITVIGTLGMSGTLTGSGANTIYVGGTLSSGSNLGGNTIIMNGTGSLNNPGGTYANGTITFNTSGSITIGSFSTNGMTYNYTAGTVTHTGSTLTGATNPSTFNTNGMSWNNISLVAGSSPTPINSLLSITGTLNLGGALQTFNGTAGWTCATLAGFTTAGITLTLQASNTYTVTTAITISGTFALHNSIVSSSGTVKAIFTIQPGATQDIGFCNGTRIDSSGGQTVWSYKGTLTTTINWGNLATQILPFSIGI